VSGDPEDAEPFTEVARIGWLLTGQRYHAQDWCERVRGDDEGE